VDFDYNAGLRKLCDEFETLLIFDEVVTGFRIGLGGAQEYFGVIPDLTVFGKAITGTYPMAGAVGGKKEIISLFAGGLGGKSKRVMIGGTLSANPLSCAAGYYSLLEIERTHACEKATLAAERLTAGLQKLVDKYELPFAVYNQFSIVHFDAIGNLNLDYNTGNPAEINAKLEERTQRHNELGMALSAEGIITIAASRVYTSLADTDEVIDDAIIRFDRLLSNFA
jgi:glutamate-1-semialdehyde aminotransferase